MDYLRLFTSGRTWLYAIVLAFFIDRGAVFTHWRHGEHAWALNSVGVVVGLLGWVLGLLITAALCVPFVALCRYVYASRTEKTNAGLSSKR